MNNNLSANKENKRWTMKKIIFILAGFFAFILVFHAAMFFIGIKTNYLHRWAGEQYFGEIIEINAGSLIVQGRSNERKVVLITEKTVVKKGPKTVRNGLQIGEKVIVFGPQNEQREIDAQLIRIFDPNDPIDSQKGFDPPKSEK